MGLSLDSFLNPVQGVNDLIETVDEMTSPPPLPEAPDYQSLAEQESIENHPNQINPYGTSEWVQDESGQWINTVTFSDEQQQLYDQGVQTQLMMGDLAHQGLLNTGDMFANPYETGFDTLEDYSDYHQGIVDDMMVRVEEDIAIDRSNKEAELIAAGIPPGSEAFVREMQLFDQQLTDARQQAELAATEQVGMMLQQDIALRSQTMTEDLTERQTPLNELNALLSGSQVSMPQFGAIPPGGDYLSAEALQSQYDLAGYNAEVAQQNAMLEGLFGLGGSMIAA